MEVLEGRWEDADHGLYADNFPIFNSNVVRRPSPSSSTTGQPLSPLGNVKSSIGAPELYPFVFGEYIYCSHKLSQQ